MIVRGVGIAQGQLFVERIVMCFVLQQMRFLHQPLHQGRMRLLRRVFHKLRHHHVALHRHVLPEPEPRLGHTQSELDRLPWFTGQGAAECPSTLHIQTHWSVDVRLQAVGKVVEGTVESDAASVEATREVVDLVGDLVPLAVVELLRGGFFRGLDRMALGDEGVQVDHFGVVV